MKRLWDEQLKHNREELFGGTELDLTACPDKLQEAESCLPSECFLRLHTVSRPSSFILDLNVVAFTVVPEQVVQPHHERHDDQGEQRHELHDVL